MTGAADHGAPRILVVGSTMMDMTAYLDRVPDAGETLHGRSFALGFGGKGANQAVMAALLGADVELCACVGSDAFADMTIANLEAVGVGTTHVRKVERESTGVAPIWIDRSGENRIVIVPGANLALTVDDVDAAFDANGGVDIVICQLEIPLECVEHAAERAAEAGALMVLNPAPAAELSSSLLRKLSWVIPNEAELAVLTGVGDGELDGVAALSRDLGTGIVVTLGPRGCALATPDGDSLELIAAPSVAARDTSGAGDAFIGAFAYALGCGHEPAAAARFASACASASVTRPGTQSSFPRGAALDVLSSELFESAS